MTTVTVTFNQKEYAKLLAMKTKWDENMKYFCPNCVYGAVRNWYRNCDGGCEDNEGCMQAYDKNFEITVEDTKEDLQFLLEKLCPTEDV